MAHPTHAAIADYYDQTALDYRLAWYDADNPAMHFGYYDRAHADTHYAALEHANAVLADAVGVADGQRILDAGCGVGGSAFWLAGRYEVEVLGVTLSAQQVAACEARAATLDLRGSTAFAEADFCAVPRPDAAFDVVWACESQCHAPDKRAFYREAYRLLRPGGRLVVADYVRRGRDLSPADETLLRDKWLAKWAIGDLDTAREHEGHLRDVGFARGEVRDVSAHVRISLRVLHEKCTRSYPLESVLRLLRIRSRVQHGNLTGAIHQYRAFERGLWRYVHVTAVKPGGPA